jgi:cytidyltransferase-like protein
VNKITTLESLEKKLDKVRGIKKIGLITGCFDILHVGHIELFKFAKTRCDYLIIGLDNDHSIQNTKGIGRPIFTALQRSNVLNSINEIDAVFIIDDVFTFGSEISLSIHQQIVSIIQPHSIITNPKVDIFCQEKKQIAKRYNVELILFEKGTLTSSSHILQRIQEE